MDQRTTMGQRHPAQVQEITIEFGGLGLHDDLSTLSQSIAQPWNNGKDDKENIPPPSADGSGNDDETTSTESTQHSASEVSAESSENDKQYNSLSTTHPNYYPPQNLTATSQPTGSKMTPKSVPNGRQNTAALMTEVKLNVRSDLHQ